MEPLRCPSCRAPVTVEAEVCPQCAAPLEAHEAKPTESAPARIRWSQFRLLTVLLAVLVAAVLFAALRPRYQEADDLRELDNALERYRAWSGNIPPDDGRNAMAVRIHFLKCYPRMRSQPDADLQKLGLDLEDLDASEALVFWLGGLEDPPGSRNLTGFSADASRPLARGGRRAEMGFRFERARLTDTDGDGWLEYITPWHTSRKTFELRSGRATIAEPSPGKSH